MPETIPTLKLLTEDEQETLGRRARNREPIGGIYPTKLVALAGYAARVHAWLARAERDQHHFGCGVYPLVDRKPLSACTCGLTALLAEIEEPQ
jgi:hypothetical protein